MKTDLCRPLLLAPIFLLTFSPPAQTQVFAHNQPEAQSAAKPPRKLKVKRGSMQDIDSIGNRNITGWDWYSIASETQMGRELAQQIDSEVQLVQDPAINAYVNRIGQGLARNSDVQVPVVIKVINSGKSTAFALPGGFLYVNTGLIQNANDEAEVAGVMAHAIAHVAARHATRLMTRSQLMNYMDTPLIQVSDGKCNVYAVCEQEQSIGLPLTFLKFSRTFELEADYLGVEYMYKAGYEPGAFVTFLERLESQEGKSLRPAARTFATHPPLAQRIQQTRKEIADILPARASSIVNTPEFSEIKARVAAVPPAPAPLTE